MYNCRVDYVIPVIEGYTRKNSERHQSIRGVGSRCQNKTKQNRSIMRSSRSFLLVINRLTKETSFDVSPKEKKINKYPCITNLHL